LAEKLEDAGTNSKAISVQYKSGLTWSSMLALFFGIVVIQPAALFLFCTTGSWLAGVSWIVVILWVEVGRLFNFRLTKQELFIIISLEGFLRIMSMLPLYLVWQGYVRSSPLSTFFGLRDLIPNYWSPPYGSAAFTGRSFLHPDWFVPAMLIVVSMALSTISGISLGYFTGHLFVRTEDLPFPIQATRADAIVSMTENLEDRLRVLTVCAVAGMIYGLLVYLVPLTSGGALQILPIPWVDLNYYMDIFLPGGSFGIHTDLIWFATGFIVPFRVVVWILIGSLCVFTFGNPVLVNLGIWKAWAPGSNIMFNWQQSFIHFWIGPVVGMSIVAAFLPILRHPRAFLRSIQGLTRLSSIDKAYGMIDLRLMLLMYFGATGGSVALMWYLVPNLPVAYFALMIIGFTFIWTMISANSVGLTGQKIVVPYLSNVTVLGSGSREPGLWFMPYFTLSDSGADWCAAMKLADLTETRFSDYVKAYILVLVVGLVMAFVYVQMLWTIGEMPSAVFPWLQIQWPIQTMFSLWWARLGVTGGTHINPLLVAGGAGVVALIYGVSEALHLPFSLIGFILGVASVPPGAVTRFLGALVGQIVLRRYFGSQRWDKYVTVIFAGLSIGEGIIITFSAAITMIMRALWILPY